MVKTVKNYSCTFPFLLYLHRYIFCCIQYIKIRISFSYGVHIETWRIKPSLLGIMAAISQTIFLEAFSRMKSFLFGLKLHWGLFLGVKLTISEYWFRQWLGAEQATSHYLDQCWPSAPKHICETRERLVKCELKAEKYTFPLSNTLNWPFMVLKDIVI